LLSFREEGHDDYYANTDQSEHSASSLVEGFTALAIRIRNSHIVQVLSVSLKAQKLPPSLDPGTAFAPTLTSRARGEPARAQRQFPCERRIGLRLAR
jgi:hypothetical protein